jgi:ribonuclease HII
VKTTLIKPSGSSVLLTKHQPNRLNQYVALLLSLKNMINLLLVHWKNQFHKTIADILMLVNRYSKFYNKLMKPTRRLENKLKKLGSKLIAGLDEAGKGALAGPIVAGCVILPDSFKATGIKDSKLLSPKKREELFLHITKNALQWSVGIIEHKFIDKIGIREANALAFKRALQKLSLTPDFLLLDGLEITTHPINYEYVVKGDNKITNIAAASIIAKVTRDHIMDTHHKDFAEYGFDQHKGYGTVVHLAAIKKHGPSEIHRMTFSPFTNIQ